MRQGCQRLISLAGWFPHFDDSALQTAWLFRHARPPCSAASTAYRTKNRNSDRIRPDHRSSHQVSAFAFM